MRRIILVGASHGWRIYEALKTLPDYGVKFTVLCLCKRGARFSGLVWPKKVELEDSLIVFPFGNDVQPKSHIEFQRHPRTIHLAKFTPYKAEYWENLHQELISRLAGLNCAVKVVDSFYRHFCCNKHVHPGWVKYQASLNSQLRKKCIAANIQVIDHRTLLPLKYRQTRKIGEYRKLMSDAVHFLDYLPIAKVLLKGL